MSELVEQFREDAEDFQQEHLDHDYETDDGVVRFLGDWSATHEAWLFRQWLDEQGYVTGFGKSEYGNMDTKAVVYLSDVDLPDWVEFEVLDENRLALKCGPAQSVAQIDDLESGVEKLVDNLWSDITNVGGVSERTVENIRFLFDTPMDGIGQFEQAEGVGSSKAEKLDLHVSAWH